MDWTMRPSLADQRRVEMIRAVEACVREDGIGGLTVQRIADRTGRSRGHVRHYLGNKSDQLQALIATYTERYASALEREIDSAQGVGRRLAVLDRLFGAEWLAAHPDDDIVLDHLAAYAASSGDPAASLQPMYERIRAAIAMALSDAVGEDEAATRSGAVIALAYGAASQIRMGVIRAAEVLPLARDLLRVTESDVRAARTGTSSVTGPVRDGAN
jgi:TetR/AcrR family transcriptional regulator, transcriptional repressor of bet genes